MVLAKRTSILMSALFMTFFLLQCKQSHYKPTPYELKTRNTSADVVAIKPSSDLSKSDAEKIMRFYFEHNIDSCGFPADLTDQGDHWSSIPRIGIVGKRHKDPIRLYKASGRITWAAGPSYDSLQALVKAAQHPPQ